jgi:hypothetical protein
MKTIAPAFAVAVLVAGNLPLQASDLSFAFAALSANSRFTSANVQQGAMAGAAMPAPTPRTVVAPQPTPIFGAYLSEGEAGLEVARVIPGSPASGAVQPGDIIRTITVLGRPARKLATMNQFEYARREVGEKRPAVLEVYRPGIGSLHVWASFESSGDVVSTPVSVR